MLNTKKLTLKEIELHAKNLSLDDALSYIKSELDQKPSTGLLKLYNKFLTKKEKFDLEKIRYEKMCAFENEAYLKNHTLICGIDEAGRGPLAGPVVASAVILPQNIFIENLNDSKKLTPQTRDKLYDEITNNAIAWAVGVVDEKTIDEKNILNATRIAMKMAVTNLSRVPDLLLIDAEKIDMDIPQMKIIKGDELSISIAAASVIAKVTRDRMIDKFDIQFPQYGFSKHKGYGTKDHIEAIKKFGICPIHRVTFTKNFT